MLIREPRLGDAAQEAGTQNDGASRVEGIAGFFQPGEKEPHVKTSSPQVVTQRRTGDGVKVYPTGVKINFSQFADEHFIIPHLKRCDRVVLRCHTFS